MARASVGLAALNLLVIAGCSSPPAPDTNGASLAFHVIEQGAKSGVKDARTTLVTNERDWHGLWGRHASIFVPPPPEPTVAFGVQRVAAIFLGQKSSTCWNVTVAGVARSANGTLLVDYRVTPPDPRLACTDALGEPHAIVLLNGTAMAAAFREVGPSEGAGA